ncbi:MAG: PfkB family carbohydrate kinase [Planctomycetota bacterium]|jgi:D-beta-D-heptose 7-phosphate kinase/D-beta-D-heptose 1-phosphate adenosyltransferase
MYEKLLKIVTKLNSPKVLLVGDFMLDAYIYGDALRISPEAPVPVLNIKKTEYSCGGAGSVAADLVALGAIPCCLGVIGNDPNAGILKKHLSGAGADITNLLIDSGRQTISKQRLIGLAQHRHRQQLIRMDTESTEPLSNENKKQLLENYKQLLKKTNIVCLQDHNKGLLSNSICQEMIALAKKAHKQVVIDPSLTDDYSRYAGATVITPNRQEAGLAVGFAINDEKTAAEAACLLAKKLKLNAVVITLDKQGAYLKSPKLSRLIPTMARSVYDVTGAGDMVLATFAITLAASCDYETAVQLANITGGIEVEKFGAVPVTIDEIINEIISRNRSKIGKIQPIQSLISQLNWHRSQKQSIVFTNGCFDVIHTGHIEFLKFCKAQGDILVLGMNSDSSVKQIKGPERPINNQSDRAAVLAALETIDYITIFDQPDPLETIKKVKPNILVKGRDWADKGVIGRQFVESSGGKVVLAPLVAGKSSTATINKMKSLE